MSNVKRPAITSQRMLTVPSMTGRTMNMTDEQARETWEKLEAAISKIHDQNASSLSFEELYRCAYNMVLHRHAQMLYNGMENSLTRHVESITEALSQLTDLAFVREMLVRWRAYHKSTQMIRDILMYMDRTFVKNFNRTDVYTRGMEIWTEHLVRRPDMRMQLNRIFLEQLSRDRAGHAVERALLLDVTKMMLELGKDVYVEELEAPVLAASREFFQSEVQRSLASMDCPEYFEAVEGRIAAEEERAHAYLEASTTKPKLLRLVIDVFISKQLEVVLTMEGSGFVHLLDAGRIPVLERIYSILKRIPTTGPKFIKDLMAQHVRDVGKALVADSEAARDAVVFTQHVLDLREKYILIISSAFTADRHFLQALNAAFEQFLNAFPRSAEYISLYIDSKLRKSLSSATDAQADETLDKVIQIFRYLQDKDMFERFYKQHLSKRLLSGRATNNDVEHIMLSKLKTECGYQFTSKLESMFMDIKTSTDTLRAFQKYAKQHHPDLKTDISVQVLTTGSWPATGGQACVMPPELEASTKAFETFYNHKHSGRRLAWHAAMGSADLYCTIQGNRVLISVTTHQMCLLMLLNDQPEISFKYMLEATKIAREDLKPALIGLSMVKGKMLLRKSPASKEIVDTDVFSFNEKFRSQHSKIKFAAAGAQKDAEISSGVRLKVEEDRKHIIEAAIVRIMKSRRQLDYNSIITEVTRHMSGRFVPVPVDIKKRIESLIEREFLERDPSDRKLYRYVA